MKMSCVILQANNVTTTVNNIARVEVVNGVLVVHKLNEHGVSQSPWCRRLNNGVK